MSFLTLLLIVGYAALNRGPAPLTAKTPLHLEEHLDAAIINTPAVPANIPAAMEWRFDKAQAGWKPLVFQNPITNWKIEPPQLARTQDALRIALSKANRDARDSFGRRHFGAIYVDLPNLERGDWGYILVRARSSGKFGRIRVAFNRRMRAPATPDEGPFLYGGEHVWAVNDGSVHTYLMRADWSGWTGRKWEGPWQQLGIMIDATAPGSLDLLSVQLVPKEANYASAPVGVTTEARSEGYRRVLYVHAPARLEYRVRVPKAGRLNVGLGVLRDDAPVTFRITAKSARGQPETLLEETYADQERWGQRSVDLSPLAGKTVALVLEAEAKRAGAVAFWAAPIVSGSHMANRPNIIFYIIDGGGADYMSVYGYNRRTTPNLERLAAEGAVFEHAYSNSSWTKPSSSTFMTSLHHSVLGGYRNLSDPVPEQAVTMAQHMHRADYQTAVFATNPNACTLSGLERGVDVLRESAIEVSSASSKELHEEFWRWREQYPAEPYWVHFQTTDVHEPYKPVLPFAGIFVSHEQRKAWDEWSRRLEREPDTHGIYSPAYQKTGISRVAFFDTQRGLYDEAMAHNDYQLGQLVERLKNRGEWERTLLIIAADHSVESAGDNLALGMLEKLPPRLARSPIFRSSVNRVPLIVVWPGHIAPGQRFQHPVSMVDVLPTILELAGLPMPEVTQGQSLAPLLLGKDGWEPRPVIIDEFEFNRKTGKLSGVIEVMDGQWGASLEMGPQSEEEEDFPERRRPVPLLLYDLWNDPNCLLSLHKERPDLVEKYTRLLEAQWRAHQALAPRFTRAPASPLNPRQLEILRSLGYVQ
jgi:arylsulfatase A-like enzyme